MEAKDIKRPLANSAAKPRAPGLRQFLITARTELLSISFRANATSSAAAACRASRRLGKLFGDQPFGITVTKLCEARHG